MYKSFANIERVRNTIPETMLRFQAIILHTIHFIANKIILFDENIIDETYCEILKNTYQVKHMLNFDVC